MAALALFSSSPSLTLSLPTAHKCSSSPRASSLRPISSIASSSSSNKSSPSQTPPQLGPELGFSRRLALPLFGLSLFLSSSPAFAKDIPLFGIRKGVEQAEKAVVEEVKELVKESQKLVKGSEKEVSAVAGAVTAFTTSPVEGETLPPAYQAGAVAGAELVAVLLAASVVNGLVSES